MQKTGTHDSVRIEKDMKAPKEHKKKTNSIKKIHWMKRKLKLQCLHMHKISMHL